MTEINREEFLNQLHDALNHLYNADHLRRSRLARMFGVADRFDTGAALRRVLADAIEALKPSADEPEESRAWRTYESLYCCFIQQLNQQIVADQLCISPRQLRREQRNALEHLADHLWARYNIGSMDAGEQPSGDGAGDLTESPASLSETASANQPAQPDPAAPTLHGELSWLMVAQPILPGRLQTEIQASLAVVQPLAHSLGASVTSQIPIDLPGLAFHPAALNQILISLLSAALHYAGARGQVTVSAHVIPAEVEVDIFTTPPAEPLEGEALTESETDLQIAGELARLSGARLFSTGTAEGSPFPMRLILPALEGLPVLVVDDNEDSLQLYHRYTTGTRYHLIHTRDTDPVMDLIDRYRPRIIVLDIMMPKENGWIVLGRLRQHPATRDIPVIICTILPQEKLALSLGASAFLKKPVSREAFLQALDQQLALLEPEYS